MLSWAQLIEQVIEYEAHISNQIEGHQQIKLKSRKSKRERNKSSSTVRSEITDTRSYNSGL